MSNVPKVSNNRKLQALGGAVITIITILLALLAIPPSTWTTNISDWSDAITRFLFSYWPYISSLVFLIIGFVLGRKVFPSATNQESLIGKVSLEDQFSNLVAEAASTGNISNIKAMGYTNETFADVIKYNMKNSDGLKFQFLVRNWAQEKEDELAYNAKLGASQKRRWKKWETIKRGVESVWTQTAIREIRLYNEFHPMLKMIIVKFSSHTLAFFSLYEWVESPENGGSPFKGAGRSGFIVDSRNSDEAIFLRYAESQFSYIWQYRSCNVTEVALKDYKTTF